jgi:hypothetical protein
MTPLLPEHIEIVDWLRIQLREGCSRIALRQHIGDVDQHVREWVLDASVDVQWLAEEIRSKMNDEGRQLRGPTLFGLFAYRSNVAIHNDRMFRRIEGMGGSSDALLGETESSDARGIVSQMMRHNEAAARIALGQTLEIVEHYKSILKERDTRVMTLEEKQMQVFDLYERLMSLQHDRDLQLIREKRSDKKHDFVREKLDMLAPVLISKVLSKGMAKGTGSVLGEELLRQFLKSLKSEQMKAIVGALSPEQVAAIMEIYERYGERDVARENAAAAKAGETPNDGAAPSTDEESDAPPATPTDDPETKEPDK